MSNFKTTLLASSVLLLCGSARAESGVDVLECLTGGQARYRSYDAFEGETIRKWHPALPPSSLPPQADEWQLIDWLRLRLEPNYPQFLKALSIVKEAAATLRFESVEILQSPDPAEVDYPSPQAVPIPSECRMVRVVALNPFSSDRAIVDRRIWESLSPHDRAVVLIHYALLWDQRREGQVPDAKKNRTLSAWMTSDAPFKNSFLELSRLKGYLGPLWGSQCIVKDGFAIEAIVSTFADGKLQEAVTCGRALIQGQSVEVRFGSRLLFWPNGNVRELTIGEMGKRPIYQFGPNRYRLDAGVQTFYEDGFPQRINISSGADPIIEFASNAYRVKCKYQGRAEYSLKRELASLSCFWDSWGDFLIQGTWVEGVSGRYEFHDSGVVKSVGLRPPGVDVRGQKVQGQVHIRPDGEIEKIDFYSDFVTFKLSQQEIAFRSVELKDRNTIVAGVLQDAQKIFCRSARGELVEWVSGKERVTISDQEEVLCP